MPAEKINSGHKLKGVWQIILLFIISNRFMRLALTTS